MPRIYVEFAKLREIGNDCKAVSDQLEEIRSDFQRTVRQLDWDIKYQSNINRTASQIAGKLEQYAQTLKRYLNFIDDACDEYIRLDEGEKAGILSYIGRFDMNQTEFIICGPGGNPFASWKKRVQELLAEIQEEKEPLSVIKALLKGSDSWGEVEEDGVLEDIISYIESFSKFFSGDKKGLTGASDWFDLADSSIGVWKGLYDYYCKMYKDLKTGFFGEVAQKRVKILSLSAGLLGLTASLLSASKGLDEKKWQSIVADYVDCGKEVISVIQSGYVLKHIGDVKSLSEVKAGPWSALNIYAAIGEAGVQAISQGFRSYEKYYADGQWGVGDTGAAGIDISMAGIYGLSHSLTLGLDDLIFSVVDQVSGGNGSNDMSYFEKAAEGYKILENKCGEAIGKWWINLTR